MPESLDEESKSQISAFNSELIELFMSLLSDLTQIYETSARILEPEAMIDPVMEFLAKDSLMTSAQKERQDKGIEEDEESDNKSQNGVLLYQSLSNLLLLISGLQSKIGITEQTTVGKLFTCISNSLQSIQVLNGKEGYSVENIRGSLRQLLSLQSSSFTRIVVKSLSSIDENLTSHHNIFINESKHYFIRK